MQQFLRRMIVFISGIFLLIFSAIGILISFNKESNMWLKNLYDGFNIQILEDFNLKMSVLTISAILLILCISVIFSLLRFNRREKTVSLDSPYGEVKVSLGAIEDFIKNIKDQIKGIKEIRPKVFVRPAGIKIYVKVGLWNDQNITDMAQEIQSTIKYYVHDTLGIKEIAEIKVLVEKILYRESGPKQLTETPRGVQYPEFD